MAHYAKVIDGIVQEVIVADDSFIKNGTFGDPLCWIKTSYNSRSGIHYNPASGEPDGLPALRVNYASIGGNYDSVSDAFYDKQPFPSWILNRNNFTWNAPVSRPDDGKEYVWNENIVNWELIE